MQVFCSITMVSEILYCLTYETRSWKGQLEKSRSWKVRSKIGKIEVGKFGPKLESLRRSWKIRAEVGKLGLKLKSTTEVGKFKMNLERINEVGKLPLNLERSISNFNRFFSTSLGAFQLKQKLSNFRLSKLKLSNFSFSRTALSNYSYP